MATKKHYKKHHKKGKGFSSITSTKRLTRIQKKQLETDLDKLVESLQSKGINKSDIAKNITKLQAVTRGRTTRKHIPEKIKSIEKYREQKFSESIGPKFYKTLTEIPTQLLNKLLSKTIEKYKIEDIEVKDIIVGIIVGEKYSKKFNDTVNIIIEINKHIIKYLRELSRYLGTIISYTMYPSSADEEAIEDINDRFREDSSLLRTKMSHSYKKLIPLLDIRNKIKTEYDKILSMLNVNKSPKITPLNIFINTIDINWLEELDDADQHKKNTVYYLNNKIDEMQRLAPDHAEDAKLYYQKSISTTFVLSISKDFDKLSKDLDKSFEIVNENYDNYKSNFIPKKTKSKSKR